MKAKQSPTPLRIALWLCLAALAGCALIFPEVVVHRTISFIDWDDYLLDLPSSFLLTSCFYQGGVQLWDFFGQVPHAFYLVSLGIFRFSNELVAIVFVLLSPFTENSGQLFDRVFATVHIGSLLCIRTIGIFLLLRRLTDDKWILRIGTVVLALLFCPPAFMFGGLYQSYIPLLMYFILSFFLTWRPVYLGMGLLFIVLCFSQSVIYTCYMYLGINLFIVSCAIYSLFVHHAKIRLLREFFVKNSRALRVGGLWLLAAAIVILAPYVYMMFFGLKDVVFDVEHSRLIGMWSPAHYFHDLKLDWSPPADFFRRMLDFMYQPGRSFFLGFTVFYLSGLAMIMSRDRRKWIFVMAVLLVWFINFPRDVVSIGFIGHWINVLTNPLKSMVRSYQTALNSIIGYLLMPLVILGLGVLKNLGRGMVFQPWRWCVFVVFLVIYAVNGCSYQLGIVKIYFAVAMAISLTALALLVFAARHAVMRRIAFALTLSLILTDMSLSAWDMKHFLAHQCILRPHIIDDLPPQIGPVGIDFHNPKIFPFVAQSEIYEHPWNGYLMSINDMTLNFYRSLNRQLAFRPADTHRPQHVAFQGWADDPLMSEYFSQNSHMFFFARYAVQKSPGIFENIIHRHLSRDVLMVDGGGPSVGTNFPSGAVPSVPGQDQWYNIVEDLRDGSMNWADGNNMVIWDFPLQVIIPDYFASNIFTRDPWTRFFIQTSDQKYTELTPAQGQLVRPMTFDVQNIKEGKVFVALPANMPFAGVKGVLLLKARDASGITSVWLHHSDQTGITFQAPADGWLCIQYPYDLKWHIELDGKQARFYRANKSFIGLPITQGEHKILVSYWPGSWLRWGLPLSATLAFILFIILIFYALHEASSIQSDPSNTHE